MVATSRPTTERTPEPRCSRWPHLIVPAVVSIFASCFAVAGLEGGVEPFPTAIELAGHRLSESPMFSYVTAFNESQGVDAVINPTLHPEIVGKHCDVYVVLAKTQEEWQHDPTLIDARSGTCPVAADPALCEYGPSSEPPCRCDFAGGTVADNVITLESPGYSNALGSDAEPCYQIGASKFCTGLGKGFDVVLDCASGKDEPDAQLGPGDYIDGFGDEAGFYVVHDTTEPALPTNWLDYIIPTGAGYGLPPGKLRERTYFPTNIADIKPVPLVVIGHGNGHQYDWYTYLQQHLASYGYVVMSHQNNTVPGSPSAAQTMLRHTDALIAQLNGPNCATIHQDLCGAIDPTKIVWIGHSRGGEGAVIAYNNLVRGDYVPVNYNVSSIQLVSSMAGPDNHGLNLALRATPGDVPFHLFYGAADDDVKGAPGSYGSPFHQLERATGPRQSTYIHGVGHAWFHEKAVNDPCQDCGTPVCLPGVCPVLYGPLGSQLSKTDTHGIVAGYYVPLLKHYLERNVPAVDFFWRSWESFRPIGAPLADIALEYEDGADPGRFVVDDFQDESGLTTSSSLGTVSFSVGEVFEGITRDEDCTFEWNRLPNQCSLPCQATYRQPFNGMTRGHADEGHRAVVFEWPVSGSIAPYFYRIQNLPWNRNMSDKRFLSFRAAQMPRHPFTQADLADLNLTVTLRDENDLEASIRIGAYDSEIEEPYQRRDYPWLSPPCFSFEVQDLGVCHCANETYSTECCNPYSSGGWQAEYETIRIPLADFLNVAPIDLSNVRDVEFQFGEDAGSQTGRLSLDDIEFTSR